MKTRDESKSSETGHGKKREGGSHGDRNATDDDDRDLLMPDGYVPKSDDVICGFLKGGAKVSGNQRYKRIIEDNVGPYLASQSKEEKSHVVLNIMMQVREGGEFIKEAEPMYKKLSSHGHGSEKVWRRLKHSEARDKCSHAVRKLAKEFEVSNPDIAARMKQGCEEDIRPTDILQASSNVKKGDLEAHQARKRSFSVDPLSKEARNHAPCQEDKDSKRPAVPTQNRRSLEADPEGMRAVQPRRDPMNFQQNLFPDQTFSTTSAVNGAIATNQAAFASGGNSTTVDERYNSEASSLSRRFEGDLPERVAEVLQCILQERRRLLQQLHDLQVIEWAIRGLGNDFHFGSTSDPRFPTPGFTSANNTFQTNDFSFTSTEIESLRRRLLLDRTRSDLSNDEPAIRQSTTDPHFQQGHRVRDLNGHPETQLPSQNIEGQQLSVQDASAIQITQMRLLEELQSRRVRGDNLAPTRSSQVQVEPSIASAIRFANRSVAFPFGSAFARRSNASTDSESRSREARGDRFMRDRDDGGPC